MAPILVGVVPFAMITGLSAVDAGLTELQGATMSVIVFAGASQLAAIDLIRQDAAVAVIVATALVINLRFAMYSASLAEQFAHITLRRRMAAAYLLTDQAYAVAVTDTTSGQRPGGERLAFYMGAALPMWATWVAATVAGVAIGAGVPDDLSLDFAIPLVFLALVMPAVRDRAGASAAVVAGALAVAAASLPYNFSLVGAALVGVAADIVAGRHR